MVIYKYLLCGGLLPRVSDKIRRQEVELKRQVGKGGEAR
jgi:hypothetical protein